MVLLLAQIDTWDLIKESQPVPIGVMLLLLVVSVASWTVIFAKWGTFRKARARNLSFLRAFRKSENLQTMATGVEQFPLSPLVSIFEYGYEEVDRQLKSRGTLGNRLAMERSLQLGVSEELGKLEQSMSWLATTASISPFIGLLGTVWGIMDAFTALGTAGTASLRVVAPHIGEALITTALGLAAAIPAAIFYNYFSHQLREMAARMEDFSLEFMNLAERSFGD